MNKITGEEIAEAMRAAGMNVQYFPLRLNAPDRVPTTSGSTSLNKIADIINGLLEQRKRARSETARAEPNAIERAYIMRAQERYALGSSDDIEVDHNALVDMIDGGAWVYGRMFVRDDDDILALLDEDDDNGVVESEGGHCD
jgi:hypothetical protein